MHRSGLARYLQQFPHPGGIVVCEEPPFIYMKAPRTGGTSVLRRVLEPAIPEIIHCKDTPGRFANWRKSLTDEQLEDYFIFSFVRNPWDRFVSIACYFHLPVSRLAADFDRLRRKRSICSHSIPLYAYTYFGGTPFVDFIGRFENLQADFTTVCERIGLPPRQLPHTSQTKHQHYSRYYDADTKETVARLYANDIEAFRYQFEHLPAPSSLPGE